MPMLPLVLPLLPGLHLLPHHFSTTVGLTLLSPLGGPHTFTALPAYKWEGHTDSSTLSLLTLLCVLYFPLPTTSIYSTLSYISSLPLNTYNMVFHLSTGLWTPSQTIFLLTPLPTNILLSMRLLLSDCSATLTLTCITLYQRTLLLSYTGTALLLSCMDSTIYAALEHIGSLRINSIMIL